MRVLTDEEKQSDELPSGSAWQVLSEDDYAALQVKTASEVEEKSPFSQLMVYLIKRRLLKNAKIAPFLRAF